MKKFNYKYFLLLLLALLSCFGLNANTNHNEDLFVVHKFSSKHEFKNNKKHFITQASLAFEVDYENTEIIESEVENSDLDFTNYQSLFYEKFINNISSEHSNNSLKNGLKDCFFTNYLTSIQSFNVLFCVFRL